MEILRIRIAYPDTYFRLGGEDGDRPATDAEMSRFLMSYYNPLGNMSFGFEGLQDEAVLPTVSLSLYFRIINDEWMNPTPVSEWTWYADDNYLSETSNHWNEPASVSEVYVGEGVFQYDFVVPEAVLSVLKLCDSVSYMPYVPGTFLGIGAPAPFIYLTRPEGDFDSAFWVESVNPDSPLSDSGLSYVDPRSSSRRIAPLSWGVQAFWTNKKLCVET